MENGLKKITVEDKILLHLFKNPIRPESFEAPMSLSQVGISKVIGVRRSHVSHAAKRLKDKDYIKEKIAHILGVKRRRKVYYLSPEGFEKAKKIHEKVEDTLITFINKDGEKSEQSIKHISRMTHLPSLEIINEIENDVFDYAKYLKKEEESSFVKQVIKAPKIRRFVGRSHEIHKIKGWISENDKNFIIVYGIAGIGKTSLTLKIVEDQYKEMDVLWFRIHEWDDLTDILEVLAEFLETLGKDALSHYLKETQDIRISDVSDILEQELYESNSVLFFDDLHKIYPEFISNITYSKGLAPHFRTEGEVDELSPLDFSLENIRLGGSYIRSVVDTKLIQFFSMLVELLSKTKGCSVVASSRFILPFYNRHTVMVQRSVAELFLEGLKIESTGKMLHGLREEDLRELYEITKGHPLFLELYALSGGSSWKTQNITEYIKSEIIATLSEKEKNLLSRIGVYRHPVPPEAFVPDDVTYDTIDSLVTKSFLKEVAQDHFDVHDIIKSFIYNRLSPKEKNENHRQAGDYFMEHDPANPEMLYHLIRQGKVQEAATKAIENHKIYLSGGKLSPLMNLTEMLLDDEYVHELERYHIASLIKVKGIIRNAWREWDNAMIEFRKALRVFQRLDNQLEIADLHNLIGTIHYGHGDHKRAIESFTTSLEILEQLKEEGTLVQEEELESSYFTLGIIYLEHGNWDNALSHYQRILKKYGKDKSKRYQIECTLAELYFKKGEYEKAIAIYKKCLKIIEELENPEYKQFDVFSNLARVYEEKGDIGESIKYFHLSLKIAKKQGSSIHEAEILYELGKLTEDEEQRLEFLHGARDRFLTQRNLEMAETISKLLEGKKTEGKAEGTGPQEMVKP